MPTDKLIEQTNVADLYTFNDEAALAAQMQLIIHWIQVLNSQYQLVVCTPTAKELLKKVLKEALNARQQSANALAMDRNREVFTYRDKIDELNNQIANLERRAQTKNARAEAKSKANLPSRAEGTKDERHTPIPDHASGSHD
jgi:uncharacterized protein YhaN